MRRDYCSDIRAWKHQTIGSDDRNAHFNLVPVVECDVVIVVAMNIVVVVIGIGVSIFLAGPNVFVVVDIVAIFRSSSDSYMISMAFLG